MTSWSLNLTLLLGNLVSKGSSVLWCESSCWVALNLVKTVGWWSLKAILRLASVDLAHISVLIDDAVEVFYLRIEHITVWVHILFVNLHVVAWGFESLWKTWISQFFTIEDRNLLELILRKGILLIIFMLLELCVALWWEVLFKVDVVWDTKDSINIKFFLVSSFQVKSIFFKVRISKWSFCFNQFLSHLCSHFYNRLSCRFFIPLHSD